MRSDDSPAGDAFAIVRLGHVEYRVTDLERARHFYVMRVESLDTGELVGVSPPLSRAVPTYVEDR